MLMMRLRTIREIKGHSRSLKKKVIIIVSS